MRAWGSCTGRAGAWEPRVLPLALSLLQGPRPALRLPEPSWKKSEEGSGLGRRGSGALPVAGRPQDLRLALGHKNLLAGGDFWGRGLGMTLSPPQQSEVMRLNDPAETLRD